MIKLYTLLCLSFFSLNLLAQPSSTPAPGHEWIMDGNMMYSNGPFTTENASGNSTIDCGSGSTATTCGDMDTSFGWDNQCAATPSTVVGTPGANFVQAQAFGNIGTTNNLELIAVPCNPGVGGTNPNENWPGATLETRRITLTNWDNLFPDAAVADGATEGTVWIPTSASLIFLDDGVGDGTGAGADELKFLVIGGNGGQCSSWDITAEYNLSIDAGPYSGIVGTENKIDETINQSLSNVPDAGSGNTYHATDDNIHSSGCGTFQGKSWYFPGGTNTGSFGTGYIETFDILSMLIEDGSAFNVDFTSNQSISLSRTSGNADAKVTMGPGMGGKVQLVIEYEIWIIQAPLPVELSSFEAIKGEQSVDVVWTTAFEENSQRFILQRSSDARDWTDLYQVETGEESAISKNYQFIDQAPEHLNYYRLKQVDEDGSIHLSAIKFVRFDELPQAIKVMPNPFSNQITVTGQFDNWHHYIIVDQQGRSLIQTNEARISTTSLSAGLYFILFKNETGAVIATQKIIKR